MSKLHIPGLGEVSAPSSDTSLILQQLGQLVAGLNAITGQLDMLIRLECGAAKRAEVKARVQAFDADRESAAAQALAALRSETQEAQNG
jgi:hypothetical protein